MPRTSGSKTAKKSAPRGARRVAKRPTAVRRPATTTMKKEDADIGGPRRAKRPTTASKARAKKRPIARRSTKNAAGKTTRARSTKKKAG